MATRLPPNGFWSYSRGDDRSPGGRLAQIYTVFADELQQQHGRTQVNLFRDASGIPPGAEWEAMIEANLAEATFLIPIITPASIESKWCTYEINRFRKRERDLERQFPEMAGRRRIFPIHYIDTKNAEPLDPDLYAELRRLQWTDFRELRFLDPQSYRVSKVLAQLATEINSLLSTKVTRDITAEPANGTNSQAMPRPHAEVPDASKSRRSHTITAPVAISVASPSTDADKPAIGAAPRGPALSATSQASALIVAENSPIQLVTGPDRQPESTLHRAAGAGPASDPVLPTERIPFDPPAPFEPLAAIHKRAARGSSTAIIGADHGSEGRIPPIGPPLLHKGAVRTATFSPDGRRLVTASDDHCARLWDPSTGDTFGAEMRHDGAVVAASFSPDGRLVVTASHDCTARLWDAVTGQPVGQPMHHDHGVQSVAFSPDGSRLVTTTASSPAISIWSVRWCMKVDVPIRHKALVHTANFSPNSHHLLTASDDYTARLWNAETGAPVGAAMQHIRSVFSATMSADGSRIVTASDDGTARLWEAVTGNPIGGPMRHGDAVTAASFSGDGRRVVTTSLNNDAQIWDTAIGAAVGPAMHHEKPVSCATFSPDGSWIVTASGNNKAQLWDGWTAKPVGLPMQHGDWVRHAAFSPNGRRVATASWDHTARLWDVSATVRGAR